LGLALAATTGAKRGRARHRQEPGARPAGRLPQPDHGRRETRYYVPKLQAVKTSSPIPASFGIELAAIPNEAYFTSVPVPRTSTSSWRRSSPKCRSMIPVAQSAHTVRLIRADGGAPLLLPMDKAQVVFGESGKPRQTARVMGKTTP